MKSTSILSALFLFLVSLATTASAADSAAVGHVKSVSGVVSVHHAGTPQAAVLGTPVYQGDELRTGKDGSIGVTFIDNSMLSLGSDSLLVVDSMVFDPVNNDLGFTTSLEQGTLVMISGLVAKLRPDSVQVNTPTSTIGIRGTRFAVNVPGK